MFILDSQEVLFFLVLISGCMTKYNDTRKQDRQKGRNKLE